MIQFVCNNEKILSLLYKIPIVKYFFVPRIDRIKFFKNQNVIDTAYRFLYVGAGTKQTAQKRLLKLDHWVLARLKSMKNLRIHDIAVSNGITSLDFLLLLEKNSMNVKFFISDKYAELIYSDEKIMRVFDQDMQFLFGYWYGLIATDKIPLFLLSKILYNHLKQKEIPNKLNPILLFNKNVIDAIKTERIKYIKYDVFVSYENLKNRFNFVRCMNLLNRSYFLNSDIICALRNILLTLEENGLFLIGRTHKDGVNRASLYQKKNNQFYLVDSFEGGSEISDIIQLL